MCKEDKYSGLSWMTDELKNQMRLVDTIVEKQDIKALFALEHNSDFSIALHQILMRKYEKDPNSLNIKQLNLFICMHLENAGQSNHILTFLQEWFPQYTNQIVIALREIGAVKSAEIIKQAIELLPENGSWFFDYANKKDEALMGELDTRFASYPDGALSDLYRTYAEKNKKDI